MKTMQLDGVAWVLIRDGWVALERCPKKAAIMGVGEWFMPGGKIEGDEGAIRACQREISEEWPGVEVLTMDPLPILQCSPDGAPLFLMQPYRVTIIGDPPETSDDGNPGLWFPIEVALLSPVPQVRMMVAAAMVLPT